MTTQVTISGRTGHMLNLDLKTRLALRELVIAAQNSIRQQRLKASPRAARKVSPMFLAILEAGALRRVS